jgi:hypothetical protein
MFLSMSAARDFSLVDGGPLCASLRRFGWTRRDGRVDYLRACIVLVAVAWGPLLVTALSAHVLVGHAFVIDWGVHARLLVAIPLLLLADASLHERTRFVVDQLVADHWVTTQQERFEGIVARAVKHRDAVVPEVLLVGIALTASQVVVWGFGGMPFARRVMTMDRHLAAARWWYALVALPLFQFLVYRALWRWGIWIQLLWRLSRLRLQPVATHPDGAGGLEFLSWPSIGFGYVIAALSATQAGVWADQVIYAGLKVTELKWQALVFALAGLTVALGPLLVLSRLLWRCQIEGQHDYASLATDYTRQFQARWVARRERNDVLGSADIQSLADLAGGYDIVARMRFTPFGARAMIALAAAAVVPMLPVALLGVPLDQLLAKLAGTLLGKPG